MDDSSRFRALTRDEQITHARGIIAMARRSPSLVRCDGSRDDYIQYRGEGDVQGWEVCGSPVRFRRVRLIVSVSHVDQITDEGVALDGSSDVELRPGVEWAEVMRRAGVTRTWERLRGRERAAVLEALLETMSDEREVPEVEGREQRGVCRERSGKNRDRGLDRTHLPPTPPTRPPRPFDAHRIRDQHDHTSQSGCVTRKCHRTVQQSHAPTSS